MHSCVIPFETGRRIKQRKKKVCMTDEFYNEANNNACSSGLRKTEKNVKPVSHCSAVVNRIFLFKLST